MKNNYLKIWGYTILTVLMFNVGASVFGQDWPKIFGDNNFNYIKELEEDYDGGILITGFEEPAYQGLGLGFLYKTDVNGNVLWKKTFGQEDYYVGLNSVEKTIDNGYLLAGWTNKYEIDWWDPLFIKLNSCGEIEWCSILHADYGGGSDFGIDAIELNDGSVIGLVRYYAGQYETTRISLVKFDKFGNSLWVQHLAQNEDPDLHNEEGYKLLLTSDSSYLVTGAISDPLFILCDSMGNEKWLTLWEADEGSGGISFNTVEDKYGNFYSGARLTVSGHKPSPAILKTDKNGNELYYGLILGDTIANGGASPLTIYNDTSIYILGSWQYNHYPVDVGFTELFVTDTLGTLKNRRLVYEYYGGGNKLLKTKDDKFLVVAAYPNVSNSLKMYLWKMNKFLEDDSLYTQPITYDSLCNHQISTDTLDLNCGIFVNIDELPSKTEYENPIKVWPNPAKSEINISVTYSRGSVIILYDNEGKVVEQLDVPLNGNIKINISSFIKGLYYVSLLNNKRQLNTRKFIVE